MTELPTTLEEAIEQSKVALQAAIADGYRRVQVELVFPEIQLKAQAIAKEYIALFEQYGAGLKVFFPDVGAAALAKRDWGQIPFKVSDLGSSRSPVENRIEATDELFLLVDASSVEIAQVEKLCQMADDRPVILIIPRLEDATTIGIGYAGRQLRERFLSTLQSCYYIRPLTGAALFRCYPSPWQVWLEKDDNYELIAQQPEKPLGDALEQILLKATAGEENQDSSQSPTTVKRSGVFGELKRFLRALSQ